VVYDVAIFLLLCIREWFKQVDETKNKENSKKSPSFTNALISMFGSQYVLPGLQIAFEQCFVRLFYCIIILELSIVFLKIRFKLKDWATLVGESTHNLFQ